MCFIIGPDSSFWLACYLIPRFPSSCPVNISLPSHQSHLWKWCASRACGLLWGCYQRHCSKRNSWQGSCHQTERQKQTKIKGTLQTPLEWHCWGWDYSVNKVAGPLRKHRINSGKSGRKHSSRRPEPRNSLESETSMMDFQNWKKSFLNALGWKMFRVLYTFHSLSTYIRGVKRYIHSVGSLTSIECVSW